jgi:hypothetical protein
MDYSYLITGLVNGIEAQAQLSLLAFNDDQTGYYLILLPEQQTVIVY